MATFQDVDNIFAKYNGKFAGPVFDGLHQCVAWAAVYSAEIGNTGYMPTPASGGARDIYEAFANPLPAQYDRIANTPTGVPKKGDIVVWGTGIGPYGHVAVATGDGDTNTFRSYDQNWVRGQAVTLTNHNYTGVKGWLRPKNLTNAAPAAGGTMAETVQQVEQRLLHGPGGIDEWIVKYAGLSDQFYAAKTQIQSQQDQIAKLTADLATAQANDASDAAKIASLEEQIKNVPSGPHQDAAQEVADQLKPVVGFWARVLKFLRS